MSSNCPWTRLTLVVHSPCTWVFEGSNCPQRPQQSCGSSALGLRYHFWLGGMLPPQKAVCPGSLEVLVKPWSCCSCWGPYRVSCPHKKRSVCGLDWSRDEGTTAQSYDSTNPVFLLHLRFWEARPFVYWGRFILVSQLACRVLQNRCLVWKIVESGWVCSFPCYLVACFGCF